MKLAVFGGLTHENRMRTLGQGVKAGDGVKRANVRAFHEQADVGRHCPALSAAVQCAASQSEAPLQRLPHRYH
jgi:hypothetical protein